MKMMNVKSIIPTFNHIVTTMDIYTVDDATEGGIVDTSMLKMSVKPYQRVIAIGSTVRDIKVGDLVKIDPSRYRVFKQKKNSIKDDLEEYKETDEYRFRTVEMNHKKYLFLSDSDVEYIIDDFEVEEPPSDIIVPNNDIITA